MNLQGIRSSVSLLGSQCKERKREEEGERGRGRAESSAESVQTVQVRGETGFPLTLSRSKLLKGWIVIAKERSYKGGNVCIFNEFARAFPGSESMGTLEGGNTVSVSDLWIFFFLLFLSGFSGRRKARTCRRNLSIEISTVLASLSSLFGIFFFLFLLLLYC